MRVGGSVKTQLLYDRDLLVWRWLHVSAILGHLQVISSFTINNNKVKIYTLDKVYPPPSEKNPAAQPWATFTYTGKETTVITKLFRRANIKIAYRTNNNLLYHLTPNPQPLDPFTRSGFYRLSCPYCSKAYIGQRGRLQNQIQRTQKSPPIQPPDFKVRKHH
jgi:hypothetical protein